MLKYIVTVLLVCSIHLSRAQSARTENLIVVVLDGMRWQEIFGGADSALINNPKYTEDKNRTTRLFWDADIQIRRKRLFPFIWETIASDGQIYGNRKLDSFVNVTNPFQMTYPGFSEMLTGFPDPAISSNRLVTSHSDNVLEYINQQKGFEGKVAVFATSDLFPYLLNKPQSKLYINADGDTLPFRSREFQLLNEMQRLSAKPTTERPDLLTYFAAREYVKTFQPRVLYLALGETDAFAHDGNYGQYLETAKAEDQMISELWKIVQSIPQYKGKTALLLTCDHGRGNKIQNEWTSHGPKIEDSGQIWIAGLGPDIQNKGELKKSAQLYQAQLASTMASILGLNFKPKTHQAMPSIQTLLKGSN